MTPTMAIGFVLGMLLVRFVLPVGTFMLLGTWLKNRQGV